MGERCAGKQPLLLHEKMTGWIIHQKALESDSDTASKTTVLPAWKVDELRAQIEEWSGGW